MGGFVFNLNKMGKYKVLIACYKQSDKKNYQVGEEIELTEEYAKLMIKEGRVAELQPESKKKKANPDSN